MTFAFHQPRIADEGRIQIARRMPKGGNGIRPAGPARPSEIIAQDSDVIRIVLAQAGTRRGGACGRDTKCELDLTWVYAELAPHYPRMGRPSVDPVLMLRMLIIGYLFAIRSERALCREVKVNLAYRWFCGLSIEDKIPDHSAFCRARNERFRDSNLFRQVFERVVEDCIAAGLVGGEGFAVDASLIAADANKQRSIPGPEWQTLRDPETASRAVKEYLATLDDAAFGAASEVMPKFISPSDPAAQWTGAMRGPAFFAYADNYLIDVKFGVIVDVEASRAIRQAEVGAAKTMIDRTEDRFGLKPARLAADTA